jgi:hypothetical protein
LEHPRISDQSIGEQPLTHVSWFDPSVKKIWTCRSSPLCGSPNDRTRIKISTVPVVWANFGICSSRFKRFPAAIVDLGMNLVISLWSGDNATINGVTYGDTPLPNFPIHKSARKFLSSNFLGIKTVTYSLIIFQRPKTSTRCISYLCWYNWSTYWSK